MRFSCPWDSNNLNDDNKYEKKNIKKLQLLSKNAKIHDVKKLKTDPL